MDEKKVKQEIQKLVDKFERIKDEGKYKKYNEENTKKDFILPLFRILGWNVEDSDEVKAEEKVSKKRVDYAFRINGYPKFYLECKPFREFISEPKYAKQAIEYAWNKSVTWAILCNFEGIRVFNAEWKWNDKQPMRNQFLDLRYNDYLGSSFEYLTWLSRENFEKDLLDKKATVLGKKTKKRPIGEQLLADFTDYRNILSKDILRNNQNMNLSQEELDEIVQRILDRIIFIRTCEDKEIESETLESLVRLYGDKKRGIQEELKKRYREYDEGYNSKLFQEHLCERVVISNDILKQVINGTYRSKNFDIRYDFSAINADVLGNIYEQYLGHILKKTSKRATIKNGKSHRKEQGIYYTPTYIVDYIVKNTVGKKLRKHKNKLDELKILDIACGSGSFLLKAFDFICENEIQREGKTLQTRFEDISSGKILKRKTELLKNCIFGVDLDSQAVEITQLNLLLKLAEKRHRLPMLQENIKCGNSLIENPEIAGDKAFKWKDHFEDIMARGGFDIIIGNPPYEVMSPKERSGDTEGEIKYFKNSFNTLKGKINLYTLMVEKAYDLLKEGGHFGFIIPNTIMAAQTTSELRTFLFKNTKNIKILEFPEKAKVFRDVTQGVSILLWEKGKTNRQKILVSSGLLGAKDLSNPNPFKIKYSEIKKLNPKTLPIPFVKSENEMKLLAKLLDFPNIRDLKDVEIFQGEVNLTVFKDCLRMENGDRLVRGDQIKRYYLVQGNETKPSFLDVDCYLNKAGSSKKALHHKAKRIAFQEVSNMSLNHRLNAVLIDKNFFIGHTCNYIISDDQTKLKLLLGLFNSSLLNWRFKRTSTTNHVSGSEVKQLPIPSIDFFKSKGENNEKLIYLVDRMIDLNNSLKELNGKMTNKREVIEEKLQKTDNEINNIVYKLYKLDKQEIEIIKQSLLD